MVQYDQKILNALLDSYENSLLFKGENKVNRSISFSINKKNLPAYFDESSPAYEGIHAVVERLTEAGYVEPVWKKGKEGHILSKITLNTEHLEQIYAYMKRTPKAEMLEDIHALLESSRKCYQTPICQTFLNWLLERLEKHQSVKEYINIGNTEEVGQLLKGIHGVEQNEISCYIREISIVTFGDSKRFEQLSGKIIKVFRTFGAEFSDKEEADIYAEYGIYHTPNYVYLKGNVSLRIKDAVFPVSVLKQGMGISGEDIGDICLENFSAIKRVITIENLTTFFRWQEADALIVYLGGYHNRLRRILLKSIYEVLPEAKYLHFGDIDAGGFEIFKDLKDKTGIPFEMYLMDLDTLKQYEKYGKALTKNDCARLEKLKQQPELTEVVSYMLERDVKLEQECVLPCQV